MAPATAAVSPDQKGTFSMQSSHTLDQLDIAFDDTHAIANAGLLLPATLAERLGVEQAADALIDLGDRPGAAHPGRKLLTLVHSMLAGADCIDDADLLRCGATSQVLGHRVMAPSTLGTFLRAFTFGHTRQLDRLTETVLARAWAAGAGPGDGPITMDLDSTVCEVHGYHKQGAAYGYTHTLGYHPLVATRADSCPGPQPAALDRPDRAGHPRGAGGGQDAAPHPAHLTRPADPLRPPPDPASARRLALGTMVRAGPGPAALHPLRHLTPLPLNAPLQTHSGQHAPARKTAVSWAAAQRSPQTSRHGLPDEAVSPQ